MPKRQSTRLIVLAVVGALLICCGGGAALILTANQRRASQEADRDNRVRRENSVRFQEQYQRDMKALLESEEARKAADASQ